MKKERLHFVSPLTIQRIYAIASRKPGFLTDGVRVDMDSHGLRIYYRACVSNNSFRPVFRGRLNEAFDGTHIEGAFDIATVSKVMVVFYRIIACQFLVLGLLICFFGDGGAEKIIFPVVVLGMLGFSVLVEKLGRYLGKKDEVRILDYIKYNLQGIAIVGGDEDKL